MTPEEWERRLVIVGDEAFLPDEWTAIPHGSAGGFVYWQCRCDPCREWGRKDRREYSRKRRAK